LRDGPRAERLSAVEYGARQKNAQRLAADIEIVERDRERVDHEIDLVEDIKARHADSLADLSQKQAEFDDGLDAMETLITQLETGEATVSDGAIQMQKPPRFLKHLFQKKPHESRTVVLFRRLFKLIVRGVDSERNVVETTLEPNEPEL